MNKNREMLREAIADAKTLKATAIANAKAALEESFNPRLQSMLAAKLEEMENEDDEEVVLENEELELDENFNSDEEMDLDEILNEIEEELDEADETEAEAEAETEEETEDEESEEESEEEVEEFDLEEMSEEELNAFIENVIADMVVAGELEPGENFETEEEGEELDIVDDDDEEIGIEIEDDELETDDLMENEDSPIEEISLDVSDQEMLLSLLAGMVGMPVAALAAAYAKDGIQAVKNLINKKGKGKGDMDEMKQEIEELKSELNETNLLNSKLLYVNKIFKSKNLTEDQKIKVISTFDKIKTVREAKIVYTTLTETLIPNKRKPIREHRGSASKSVGAAPKRTAKQPIMEVNQQVERWKKLAGITEQTKH